MKFLRDKLKKTSSRLYKNKGDSECRDNPTNGQIKERIEKAMDYINENFCSELSREGLACLADMSADNFSRSFNKIIGIRLDNYINNKRIDLAKELIQSTNKSITRVAMDCGFDNVRTFNRIFKEIAGITPTEFKKTINVNS